MSLFGMMRTGTSGMNSQASRLSTVAENIANASTTGYKKARIEFSTLLLPSGIGSYNSGSMQSNVTNTVSQQGALAFTTSSTDLAISGGGFFVVESADGIPYLTRAGSFTPDGDGYLVNSAGYKLLGADYNGGDPTPVVNGFDGLEPVNINSAALTAVASTSGIFTANLDSREAIVTGSTPLANLAASTYTSKSSLVAYDSKGAEVLLDFYYTKTAANTWEVSVFDKSDADPNTTFPYGGSGRLGSQTLVFEAAGSGLTAASATDMTFTVPDGLPLTIDFSNMSELATEFSVSSGQINGQSPNDTVGVDISEDGTVYARYENGELSPIFRLAMADVPSPDNLTSYAGNIYSQSTESGVVIMGFAGSDQFGSIQSGALESSNVDIAEELTMMIESQRSYTANSKVFQTGADLMEILVNMAR